MNSRGARLQFEVVAFANSAGVDTGGCIGKHWRDLALLPSAWSQSELLAYIDELRQRVNDALSVMIDEKASTPLPATHQHKGQPYA